MISSALTIFFPENAPTNLTGFDACRRSALNGFIHISRDLKKQFSGIELSWLDQQAIHILEREVKMITQKLPNFPYCFDWTVRNVTKESLCPWKTPYDSDIDNFKDDLKEERNREETSSTQKNEEYLSFDPLIYLQVAVPLAVGFTYVCLVFYKKYQTSKKNEKIIPHV